MGGIGGNASTQVLKITNIGLTWQQLMTTVSIMTDFMRL